MFAPGMGPYVAITVVKTPWIKDLIQTLWIKQLPHLTNPLDTIDLDRRP